MNPLYGDSLSNPGIGASPASNAWAALLSAAIGKTFTNLAASGAMSGDMSIQAHNAALAAADIALCQIGTNDLHTYLSDPVKQGYFEKFIRSILVHNAAPQRLACRNMTLTPGIFSNSQPSWSHGIEAVGNAGATAVGQVSGSVIYVTTIIQDIFSGTTINGTADVLVDGTKVGFVNSNGAGMTTGLGANFAPACYRFVAPSAGLHNIQLLVTSAQSGVAGVLYLEDVIGNTQPVKPSIYVGNVPKYSAAGYSIFGGSDTVANQLSAIIANVIAELVGDGFPIIGVNTESVVDPVVDIGSDGVHWNNAGHAAVATAYQTAISGAVPPPTYTDGKIIYDASNNVFAAKLDGTILKQL